ncbi:hypothetical protein [Nonomuraea sp. NPDC050643]|uniref:hypothetical protein n=1 Tax=Nonomuraea sp. NPDC050643 TaxID=3155660 RepID=UPI0033C5FA23
MKKYISAGALTLAALAVAAPGTALAQGGATERLAVAADGTRSAQAGRLAPGAVLNPGQWVASADGRTMLVQQKDGNLVMQRNGKPIWDTRTGQNPGAWLGVQDDGNVVVVGKGDTPLWSTRTATR